MAGTRTYAEMMDVVTLNMGNDSALDTASYTGRWVNDAYIDLTTKFEIVGKSLTGLRFCFPELASNQQRTTTDGTGYIAKPLDCTVIDTVYDVTNDYKLTHKLYKWYLRQTGHADTSAEGKPKFWTPYGLYVYLHPTPDSAYQLEIKYRRRPVLLSATDSVTEISPEWDEYIEMLATVKGFFHLQDFDKALKWKAEFIEGIAEKLRMQNIPVLDTKEHLRPDSNYLDWGY